MKKTILIGVVLLFGIATRAGAVFVPVDSGDYSGSRASDGVVMNIVDGPSEFTTDFTVSWEISGPAVEGDYWSYTYTISLGDGVTENPDYFILEVSDFFNEDNFRDYVFNFNAGNPDLINLGTWTETGDDSGPFLPEPIYGIKFDYKSDVYSFDSSLPPMWGDFYTEGAWDETTETTTRSRRGPVVIVNTVAYHIAWYNAGVGDPTLPELPFNDWIPVPDPPAQVPEPTTMLLLGSGLIGLAVSSRRKFRR